ncbi:ABC transporter ATPase [Actinoplanes sp. SE50]|uniref:ATP-binding cassette domain-containing protein n=1 Tax=unclassified Actinoplanes TaxID=2626549 RepID=UPI00023ED5C4|nr:MULTISPECIES: ATP-binding cassette domain-containing protein [unclassified Actinoplanes]AEV83929.1 Multidrug resistance protein 2 [Actinoplanes sp. SE50/110]ATO81927.1 ABC transporter ATPase [Actinoplanes sp. SE50]SLL99335.1 glutathione/cysteine ABC transporter permease/ATPase [Actinoplanes sp. SE50/110]
MTAARSSVAVAAGSGRSTPIDGTSSAPSASPHPPTAGRPPRGPIDPRLLRHARTARAGIALQSLIGIGQAAATLAIAVALTRLIAPSRPHSLLFGGSRGTAVALLAAAFTTRALLAWAEQVTARRTAAKVTDELRRRLLGTVVRRGPAWVASFGAGRLTTILGTGLDSLRPWFAGYLPSLILGVTLPPVVLTVMFLADPASAVIALLTLPLVPILGALIGWATQARAEQRWAADARLAGHFLDVVQGLGTLRMYGRADRQTTVIADLTDRHRRATLRVLRVAFLSSTALDLVGTLSVGLIAVQAGIRVAGGSMPLAPALLAILLAPEAYRPLREMAARYHAATDATAVITDVTDILTPPAAPLAASRTGSLPDTALSQEWLALTHRIRSCPVPSPSPLSDLAAPPPAFPAATAGLSPALPAAATPTPALPAATAGLPPALPAAATPTPALPAATAPGPSAAATPRWGVLASGVRASYPGSRGEALSLPELAVQAGEFVALRGPSGAGKSTLLRVLAGLHPADRGALAVGRTFHLSQRPALPHARTIGEAFPAGATDDEIRSALHLVGLDTEVTPQTPLGEHGRGISAGQRQRLALAALLHRATHLRRGEPAASRHPGPVVTLLLDEPTAHLDPAAERLVITHLQDFARRGCAVLVVAHRPALLAAADRIVDLTAPPGITTTPADSPACDAPGEASREHPASAPRPAEIAAEGSWWRRPWVAVALGAAAVLGGLTLTGSAAWLLVRAATLPPVLTLSAAVVLVRGSAVARPLLRYLERLVAHDVAFARLGRRRAAVYAELIPRVPGPRLHRRGDLLTRLVDDVDARVDGLLRGWFPILTAAVTVAVAGAAALTIAMSGDAAATIAVSGDAASTGLAARAAGVAPAVLATRIAGVLALGIVITGVVAPLLAWWQADRQEAATGSARAALRDAMVETVDGVEELGTGAARSGVPENRSRTLAVLEARAARTAGLAAAVAHLGWAVAAAGTAIVLGRAGLSAEWSAVLLLGVIALGEPLVALPEAAIARRHATGAEHRVAALTTDDPTARRPATGAEHRVAALATDDPTARRPATGAEHRVAALATDDPTARRPAPAEPDATGETPATGADTPTDEIAAGAGPIADSAAVHGTTPVDPGHPAPPPASRPRSGEVIIEALVAAWDPQGDPTIDGLSLHLRPGARAAVTGRSGSGKSTLAAVLGGLLRPRSGEVRVGGRAVLVSDETGHVFASDVRENLRLAAPAASDGEVVAALRRVGLGPWLDGLAAGLDTWLGTGGSTMSGGQRRRLATARALLADPALLILDEPTEGIDEAGARELMADLLDAASGRTVLVFAHRAEGLDLVDQIYELSNGRLNVGLDRSVR